MANQAHIEAEQKRESGDFVAALTLTDQSLLEYQKEKNYAGMAEVLCSRYLTLVHLFEQSKDSVYLTLALGTAHDAYLVSQSSADQSAQVIPLYNYAKALERQGELPQAIEKYKQSIDLYRKNTPASHDQPAVLIDMQIHLGLCELKNNDVTAYDRVISAVEQLKSLSDEPYRQAVWISGAHLKLAEILASTDRQKSILHLKAAEEIISGRSDMILRQKQLQNLKQQLGL
jgi:tetratricopeptide (TPR) repeat protein